MKIVVIGCIIASIALYLWLIYLISKLEKASHIVFFSIIALIILVRLFFSLKDLVSLSLIGV